MTAICKYLIAVGALGLVFAIGFVAFSLWTLLAHRVIELWWVEALLNTFWMVWWYVGVYSFLVCFVDYYHNPIYIGL